MTHNAVPSFERISLTEIDHVGMLPVEERIQLAFRLDHPRPEEMAPTALFLFQVALDLGGTDGMEFFRKVLPVLTGVSVVELYQLSQPLIAQARREGRVKRRAMVAADGLEMCLRGILWDYGYRIGVMNEFRDVGQSRRLMWQWTRLSNGPWWITYVQDRDRPYDPSLQPGDRVIFHPDSGCEFAPGTILVHFRPACKKG